MAPMDRFEKDHSVRKMMVFCVIETSDCVGNTTDIVNAIMDGFSCLLSEYSNVDAYVQVLEYNNDCKWTYPRPIPYGDFHWKSVSSSGCPALATVFKTLELGLHRSEYLSIGQIAPLIILVSDGKSTDDIKDSLEVLKKNIIYREAIKIAVGVGTDLNESNLVEFTGNPEMVFAAPDEMNNCVDAIINISPGVLVMGDGMLDDPDDQVFRSAIEKSKKCSTKTDDSW